MGIDPHPQLLHAWGLDDSPAGLERFCHTVVDAAADVAAVAKPQSAFFERWGSRGIAVLERLLSDLREAGVLTVLDVKRGDIPSTMAAYAEAYLDEGSPLACDAITVHPYLGFGSLSGAIASAVGNDAGLFVLARTSNPQAAELQDLVADRILDSVAAANTSANTAANTVADTGADSGAAHEPLGPVGVVLGATLPSIGYPLERLRGPVLVPGVGAQGASPADVARLFASVRQAVVPSVSRAVLADPARVRERVTTYRDELAAALS